MKKCFKEYEIDDFFDRVDFNVVEKWLSGTYWSPGIEKSEIIQGAKNSSAVVGCYYGDEQVAYLRVISDRTRFAYFLDVFVDEKHRRKGIAQAMIKFVFEHPDFKDVYQWLLATRDGHGVYTKLGFQPLPNPEAWMIIKKPRGSRAY